MLSFINKKIAFAMIAKKAGIDQSYLQTMFKNMKELFPDVDVEGFMIAPQNHLGIVDKYADMLQGKKAEISADYIVTALELIDPEGKAFSLIDYVSALPVLDLGDDYADVPDFLKRGLFPSLLKLRAANDESSICPRCFSNSAEKVTIQNQLHIFCPKCGEQ
jgi:hypothetical protein